MSFFGKKINLDSIKSAATNAALKVTESAKNVDIKTKLENLKETATTVAVRTSEIGKSTFEATREKAISTYDSVSEELRTFDYSNLKEADFYQEKVTTYSALGAKKITEYFHATLEINKSTMEMVDDLRRSLPVPTQDIDDIFEQCRREAFRRAIASFALNGVLQDIDNRSSEKYSNLSETYSEFKERSANAMIDDPNFATMNDQRKDAQKNWTQLEDGYNKASPLDAYSADIEHVISKNEFYDDLVIRAGTTDNEFYSAINSKENLVFADYSFNRSMKDMDINDYLDQRGRPDISNPNLVHIDIKQQDGTIKTVTVNRDDVNQAYETASDKKTEHKLNAVKEIGVTAVTTGAAMAIQQVVGLIILETIDIFVDEIKDLAINGSIFNENGVIQNTKDMTSRIQQKMTQRFEERKIWARAKSLGIEAGVAGALSVIPQIIISLIIKLPSFVLALIREGTLSVIRCVRVIASKDDNKLSSIKVILAGTASAIVGIYAGRVISNGIIGVPLLNRFNRQVTDVLTGLLVTAVPLVAIYTFEKNKARLRFAISS